MSFGNVTIKGRTYLCFDVHHAATQQHIYTLTLLAIYDHEKELDRGRFESFSMTPQEHAVSLPMIRGEPVWVTSERWVNWIAEQATSPWCLEPKFMEVFGVETFRFSFEDVVTAVAFKLVFG